MHVGGDVTLHILLGTGDSLIGLKGRTSCPYGSCPINKTIMIKNLPI